MINSTSTNKPKENVFSGLGASLGMSAVMTGGFGSVSSIKQYGGIGKTRKEVIELGKSIKNFKNNINPSQDTFVGKVKGKLLKDYAGAQEYEELKNLNKNYKKAEKELKKFQDGKKTLFQKLKKVDESVLQAKVDNAAEKLKSAKETLENGEVITKNTYTSFGGTVKSSFIKELRNPINIGIVAISCINRIKTEAVPVFENESKVAGIKKAGEILFKTAADTVSNAGFSVAFRWLGTAAGSIFGPAGGAIGGTVGDMVGSFFSNKFIAKIFGEDKKEQQQTENYVPKRAYIA